MKLGFHFASNEEMEQARQFSVCPFPPGVGYLCAHISLPGPAPRLQKCPLVVAALRHLEGWFGSSAMVWGS